MQMKGDAMTGTTWVETLRNYAEDPYNTEKIEAVLRHPDYTIETLVTTFLDNRDVFQGCNDTENILFEVSHIITPELWVKLATYQGKQEHIPEFMSSSPYEDRLREHMTDLTWDEQVAFLSPLLTSDKEDGDGEASYLVNAVATSLKWPTSLAKIAEVVGELSETGEYSTRWKAWKQLIELANKLPD